MKKLLPVLAIALSVSSAAVAQPPRPAPVNNWTGWYAGINAGSGWNDANLGLSPNDPAALSIFPAGGAGSTLGFNGNNGRGAVGGFQFGYNSQFASRWIAGVEADFDFSGIKSSTNASGSFALAAAPPGTPQAFNTSSDLKWFGTVRGRLGFLANDSVLLFATGGLAYGQVDQSAAFVLSPGATTGIARPDFAFICVPGAPCIVGSQSQVNVGWTTGGGAEWLLWKNLSLKAEYSFIDLGSHSYNMVAINSNGVAPASLTVKNEFQYHIVRAGLNWHF